MFGCAPATIRTADNLEMEDRPRQENAKITYRPDVDGLRAVAVLLVVFDHLQTRVTGGYVGVDVFFVISGYLISSVILKDIRAGTFSVTRFYERRIRRIVPALLVMLLGCAALSYFYFLPSEIDAFARSLLAALFSISNLLFWSQAGYFDTANALKPLLHTWSLGVEEQFYFVFPLFLLGIRRWLPGRMRIAIWSITVLTLGLAAVCVLRHPAAAFFFAPLRAWELLLGTIVSQRYVPVICGGVKRNLAAVAGLLLIFVPAMIYTGTTPFPGLAALPPCVGAALFIAAGESGPTLVGRALAWRPVVFIGLISYSLYLWHWPILVFAKANLMLTTRSGTRMKLLILVASIAAATLSWRFVERPFRIARLHSRTRWFFVFAGVPVAFTAAAAVVLIACRGFPSRFPSEALAIDRYTSYDVSKPWRVNACFVGPDSTMAVFDKAACLADDPTRKHYLLMGDSHAAHLYTGLHSVFPELNLSQATAASCKPLLDQSAGRPGYCTDLWAYIYGDYLTHHRIDAVLISGQWSARDFPALARTVEWIKKRGIQVILFGPVTEFDVPLPRLLTVALVEPNAATIDQHRNAEPMRTDERLSRLARNQWKVRYISAYENLCASDLPVGIIPLRRSMSGCPVYAARGVPLLFDGNHFTPEGSILYARTMRDRRQLP